MVYSSHVTKNVNYFGLSFFFLDFPVKLIKLENIISVQTVANRIKSAKIK